MKKTFWLVMVLCLFGALTQGSQAFGAEEGKYGGKLTVIWDKPAISFGYPPKIVAVDQHYASVALETMLVADPKGKLYPHLATSWDLAEDGKSYIIKLRKGVKFHDGTDFNAEAFKFNMDMWIGKPTGAFTKLTSAVVMDDYTVRLNASEYEITVPYELATEAYMVSPKAIKENGAEWAETHPVGTGPFKFVSYDRPNKLTWTRFDDYWQKGKPFLDGVEYLLIRDRMTSLSALKAGQANGIYYADSQHAKTMSEQGWMVLHDNPVGIHIYGDSINPNSPWANKKVREAVEYAIDKDAICKQLSYGYYLPMYQIVKPDSPAYVTGLKPRKYDPQKAKELLKEAGYPKGFNAEFIYLNTAWKEAWEASQNYLAAVGINLKLTPVERPKYVTIRFQKGNLPAGNGAQMVCTLPPDALYMLKTLLSGKVSHVPEMKRPEGFDELIDKAVVEKDPNKSLELTKQLVKMAYDEAMYIPFYGEGIIAIMSPKVKDYDLFEMGFGAICPFINTYMEKK
jgi:peptide/nickel transport system substrate-binding protein